MFLTNFTEMLKAELLNIFFTYACTKTFIESVTATQPNI